MRNAYHTFLSQNKGKGLSRAELGARFRALPPSARTSWKTGAQTSFKKDKKTKTRIRVQRRATGHAEERQHRYGVGLFRELTFSLHDKCIHRHS